MVVGLNSWLVNLNQWPDFGLYNSNPEFGLYNSNLLLLVRLVLKFKFVLNSYSLIMKDASLHFFWSMGETEISF